MPKYMTEHFKGSLARHEKLSRQFPSLNYKNYELYSAAIQFANSTIELEAELKGVSSVFGISWFRVSDLKNIVSRLKEVSRKVGEPVKVYLPLAKREKVIFVPSVSNAKSLFFSMVHYFNLLAFYDPKNPENAGCSESDLIQKGYFGIPGIEDRYEEIGVCSQLLRSEIYDYLNNENNIRELSKEYGILFSENKADHFEDLNIFLSLQEPRKEEQIVVKNDKQIRPETKIEIESKKDIGASNSMAADSMQKLNDNDDIDELNYQIMIDIFNNISAINKTYHSDMRKYKDLFEKLVTIKTLKESLKGDIHIMVKQLSKDIIDKIILFAGYLKAENFDIDSEVWEKSTVGNIIELADSYIIGLGKDFKLSNHSGEEVQSFFLTASINEIKPLLGICSFRCNELSEMGKEAANEDVANNYENDKSVACNEEEILESVFRSELSGVAEILQESEKILKEVIEAKRVMLRTNKAEQCKLINNNVVELSKLSSKKLGFDFKNKSLKDVELWAARYQFMILLSKTEDLLKKYDKAETENLFNIAEKSVSDYLEKNKNRWSKILRTIFDFFRSSSIRIIREFLVPGEYKLFYDLKILNEKIKEQKTQGNDEKSRGDTLNATKKIKDYLFSKLDRDDCSESNMDNEPQVKVK